MALLQGIKKLFRPLLDDLDCVSAVKEAIVAGRGLHVMALHQEIKKLFGPLLVGLDCVSAVKDKQTSRNDFFANFLKSLINPLIRFFGVNSRY
jgi:hypothetical protein